MKTPRIVLGDSPRACLRYARHALVRAKRAARMGDLKEAGRWYNEAGETGMLPVIEGPYTTGNWRTNGESRSMKRVSRAYAESQTGG